MKTRNLFYGYAAALLMAATAGCDTEAEYYSQVRPETFFDSKEKVYQRMARPFTHWLYMFTNGGPRSTYSYLNEFSADGMVNPARGPAYDGGDWYDDGYYLVPFYHNFNPSMGGLNGAWGDGFARTVSEAYSALDDIEKYADFAALKFANPQQEKDAILMQLQVIVASGYLFGLDMFGGLPIYRSNNEEAKPRATAQETFNFIEELLLEAIPKLPESANAGYINRTAGAMFLARLYFNAQTYVGTPMYDKCAEVCKKILPQGEYNCGHQLAARFQDIFGPLASAECKENILMCPFKTGSRTNGSMYAYSMHYGMRPYFGLSDFDSYNGYCLTPSVSLAGKSWWDKDDSRNHTDVDGRDNMEKETGAYKLGSPFAKIHKNDLRKKNYTWLGGDYEGMFLFGKMVNSQTGGAAKVDGSKQYPKMDTSVTNKTDFEVINNAEHTSILWYSDTLVLVDRIAKLAPVYKKTTYTNSSKSVVDRVDTTMIMYLKANTPRREGARYAEENSGVRLMKFQPIPNDANKIMRYNAAMPILRLAEAYYMLAECQMRGFGGSTTDAANNINEVRKRYFTGTDPDAVAAADLSDINGNGKWRMLDEWLIEFIGEGRRRIDLVRWGEYASRNWWDKGDASAFIRTHHNLMPLPTQALSGNPLLEQNAGYGGN